MNKSQGRQDATTTLTRARRDRAATTLALRHALACIRDRGGRISISAVAKEAGVDPSLVHHVYPDLAEEIRAVGGRSTRAQRDGKHAELVKARALIRELRQDVALLLGQLAEAASLNLMLLEQIKDLQGVVVLPVQIETVNG